MRRPLSIFVLIGLMFIPASAFGALQEVPDRDQFGPEAADIGLDDLSPGTNASRQLAKWGLEFVEGSHGVPTVAHFYQPFGGGLYETVIENSPAEGDSVDKEMILYFPSPAAKVGFNLYNLGSSGIDVTLTAYDARNELIGTLTKAGAVDGDFLGVESTLAQGISFLQISYGEEERAEQIGRIILEMVEREQFVSYLAQYADGPIPGTGALQTIILVTNLSDSTATGSLEFFKSDGNPEMVDINGEISELFELEIPPYSARTFSTPASLTTLVLGYAKISCNVPFAATGIFRTLDPDGEIISEAGLGLEEGAYSYVGGVKQDIAGGLKSGIAVANITNEPINAAISLYDEDGDLVGTNSELLQLEAGAHRAVYLSEMFTQLAGQDFSGTIRVSSSGKIAGVILRSVNTGFGDIIISSLPLGTLEK